MILTLKHGKGEEAMDRKHEKFPYENIVHLQHHVSTTRKRMSMIDRAAQFSPFMALSGYDAAIQETARLTDEQIEMEEDRKAELDRKLQILGRRLSEYPDVTITYFQPDEKKTGGAYVAVVGRLKKIDDFARVITLVNGMKIRIDHVVDVESKILPPLME